jgi:small nuclear ribonucleoprotein (snRNP)-like protein
MELALTIIAGLGALLFVVSYLTYVVSGFKHHFVTGLIAVFPVLNIVTLPSLWDKNRGKFIVGMIGLLITGASWVMGANKGILNLLSKSQNTTKTVVLSADSKPNKAQQINTISAQDQSKNSQTSRSNTINEEDMIGLPGKALYSMSFDLVPVDQIMTLQGRIVQITVKSSEQVEGRIKSVSQSSVIVEGASENEIPLASIKQLRLMVKKANQ